MSIETFCLKNKVPYNLFSKWYKDTRMKVVEVQVDGFLPSKESPSVKDVEMPLASRKESVRILVDLRISNGLHIHQKNLSYQSLRSLIEKLQSRLDEDTRKRKEAERKAQRLDERLKYANSSRFGDKRQKVRKDLDKAEEADLENL